MDWSEFLNWFLTGLLTTLGGLFAWYVKFKVPKAEARKERELAARLDAETDVREYEQKTENIAINLLKEMIYEKSREANKEQEIRELHHKRVIERLERIEINLRTLAGVIQQKLEAGSDKAKSIY